MKLSDDRQDYYEFSAKTSDTCRNIAFAGIALVWIFKVDAPPGPRLPEKLIVPTGLLAVSLGLDLLQYVLATAMWGAFYRHHEKNRTKQDPDLDHPHWFLLPLRVAFWGKIACVFAAYWLIGAYIFRL
jgi:hypothetical protein